MFRRVWGSMPPPPMTHILRYGLAGLGSTAAYFLLVVLEVEFLKLDPVLSAVTAVTLITFGAYVVNRRWVFQSSRNHAAAFPRFVIATVFGIGLNTGIMYVTVHVLGWSYITGLIITSCVVPATNFVLNYLWCFRPEAPVEADSGDA